MKALIQILAGLFVIALYERAFSAETNSLRWRDARELALEGKGWADTKDFYDRLSARAEKNVRLPVWNLSHDSAGMCVRFVTDATAISARWTLRKELLALPHMPASGVSGVDLYVRDEAKWAWLGSGRPDKFPTNERQLVKDLRQERREFILYFPLYNGVTEMQIGVAPDAHFEAAPARTNKPMLFYGTSILQGGCASRPGMAYPAILGRRCDWPALNLGFSSNALSEPEIARLFAELDPAVYVLDPLPNMGAESVRERSANFIQTLRKAHPQTPIVLVENVEYPDGKFVEPRHKRYSEANAELKKIYERLVREGDRKLFYVPGEKLFGSDGEATVDGTHPTDLGFLRMADAIEPILQRALKAAR